MIESQRRAYLQAMGLDVWISKPAEAESGRLFVGPGQGSTLLVCETAADSVTKFAGDIVRALGDSPVWAWPDPHDGTECPTMQEAVTDRMITRVFLFGSRLPGLIFKTAVPDTVGSAVVNQVASLQELATDGAAKKALWKQFRD